MAVVVEFTLDSETFPFGRATSGDPGVRVQLERVVPLDTDRIPFVWATGSDLSRFEDRLMSSEIVSHVEALTRVGDSVLYAVEWYESEETFMNGLVDTGATIMEAHGDDTWSFTLRFRSHSELTRFHQFYQEEEFPVHIDRVYTLDEEPASEYGFGLTLAQREALTLAVERGYFAIPRETQLDDIADELDISKQAASERVRRGTETVLRKALVGLVVADLGSDDDNRE